MKTKSQLLNMERETLQSIADGRGVGWTQEERDYARLLANPPKCPTCGQPVPLDTRQTQGGQSK